MKKKIALILFLALALSVAVGLCVLSTMAETDYATGIANALWESANPATEVTLNGSPVAIANGLVAGTDGTYHLEDGVLTLSGFGKNDTVNISANGSLKVEINGEVRGNISADGALLLTGGETQGTLIGQTVSADDLVIYGNIALDLSSAQGPAVNGTGATMVIAPAEDSVIATTDDLAPAVNYGNHSQVIFAGEAAILISSTEKQAILCDNQGFALKENVCLNVRSNSNPLGAVAVAAVDPSSVVTSVPVGNGLYQYTFQAAGKYSAGFDVIEVSANDVIYSSDVIFRSVAGDSRVTGGIVRFIDSNGTSVTLFDSINDNVSSTYYISNTSSKLSFLSYNAVDGTVTLNNFAGSSLAFDIPAAFRVYSQGDNVITKSGEGSAITVSEGFGGKAIFAGMEGATLTVDATKSDKAILSNRSVEFASGLNLTVNAYNHPIYVAGSNALRLDFTGATVTAVSAYADDEGRGLYSSGSINISDGTVNSTSAGTRALYVDGTNSTINISGGTVNAKTTLSSSGYVIDSKNIINISGGTVVATGANNVIRADNSIFISRAKEDVETNVQVDTYYDEQKKVYGDGGFVAYAGDGVDISGGNVTITVKKNGIRGGKISISGGVVNVIAKETAANIDSTHGSAICSDNTSYTGLIDVSGGTVIANGSTKTIYSYQTINISGGFVTANAADGVAFKADYGSITLSGGKVEGTGAYFTAGGSINLSEDARVNYDYTTAAYNGTPSVSGGTLTEYNGRLITRKIASVNVMLESQTVTLSAGITNNAVPFLKVNEYGDLVVLRDNTQSEKVLCIYSETDSVSLDLNGNTLTVNRPTAGYAIYAQYDLNIFGGGTLNVSAGADYSIGGANITFDNVTVNLNSYRGITVHWLDTSHGAIHILNGSRVNIRATSVGIYSYACMIENSTVDVTLSTLDGDGGITSAGYGSTYDGIANLTIRNSTVTVSATYSNDNAYAIYGRYGDKILIENSKVNVGSASSFSVAGIGTTGSSADALKITGDSVVTVYTNNSTNNTIGLYSAGGINLDGGEVAVSSTSSANAAVSSATAFNVNEGSKVYVYKTSGTGISGGLNVLGGQLEVNSSTPFSGTQTYSGGVVLLTANDQPNTMENAVFAGAGSNSWIYWGEGAAYEYFDPMNKGTVLVSKTNDEWIVTAPVDSQAENIQYLVGYAVYSLSAGDTVTVNELPVIRMVESRLDGLNDVQISWSGIHFEYTVGKGWVPTNDNTVIITNSGKTILVSLEHHVVDQYAQQLSVNVLGNNGAYGSETSKVRQGENLTYTISLAGRPSEDMDAVIIGTLTLHIEPLRNKYNTDIEHLFFATGGGSNHIYLFDLNDYYNGGTLSPKKTFTATYKKDYRTYSVGDLTAAKLRYSEKLGKDVVIACASWADGSSIGWVGVFDYQTLELFWHTTLQGGPHDVEMLPNGDLVVGVTSSDDEKQSNRLVYYPASGTSFGSATQQLSIKEYTSDGHGVAWDEVNECLWVLRDMDILQVQWNEGSGTPLEKTDTYYSYENYCSNVLPDRGVYGHCLVPMFDGTNRYLFSTWDDVIIFDPANESQPFIRMDICYQCGEDGVGCGTETSDNGQVKGVAFFEDGTMILTPGGYNQNINNTESNGIHAVIWEDGVATHEKIPGTGFSNLSGTLRLYKVYPVTTSYR